MVKLDEKVYMANRKKSQFNGAYEMELLEAVYIDKYDENDELVSVRLGLRVRNDATNKEYDINPLTIRFRKKDTNGVYQDSTAYDYTIFYELMKLASHATGVDADELNGTIGLQKARAFVNGKMDLVDKQQYTKLLSSMKGKKIGMCLTLVQKYKKRLVNGLTLAPLPKDDGNFYSKALMNDPNNVWVQDYTNRDYKPEFNVKFFYDVETGKTFDEISNNLDAEAVDSWVMKQSEIDSNVEELITGKALSSAVKKMVEYNYKRTGGVSPNADEYNHDSVIDAMAEVDHSDDEDIDVANLDTVLNIQ